MSEIQRALIVVMALTLAMFVAQRRGLAPLLGPGGYPVFRNTWIALTLVAFLSGNFWVFVAGAAVILAWVSKRAATPAVLFPGLVLCLPPLQTLIPSFGIVNYLFHLNFQRLLVLVLLAPAALALIRSAPSPHVRWPDRLFTLYVLVQIALTTTDGSATAMLRGVWVIALDQVIPYIVLSRAITSLEALQRALAGMLLGATILAGIAAFENIKGWLLYASLASAWGVEEIISPYLPREGRLRAQATAGHAIALGYTVMAGMATFLCLRTRMSDPAARRIAGLALFCGIVAPLSRGPWVGALVILLVHALTAPAAARQVTRLVLVGLGVLLAAALLPGGDKLIRMLPFLGNVEQVNIDYRERLVEHSLDLLREHPLFGPPNYMERLASLGMVQGQGIVDIVNTYVGVALNTGYVGLALFAGFFLSVLLHLRSTARRRRRADDQGPDAASMSDIGRGLLAGLAGMLVTLATVSTHALVHWVLWSFAGLCVAYLRVAATERFGAAQVPVPAGRPHPGQGAGAGSGPG